MKLMIDIPENGYQTLTRMKKSQGSLGYYHEIILNGVPVSDSADIEKIRAEIQTQRDGIIVCNEYEEGWAMALEWVMGIIDKELGGNK